MLKSVSFTFSSPAGLVQSSRDLRPVHGLQSLLHCYFSGFSLCCGGVLGLFFFPPLCLCQVVCIDLVSTEFSVAECTDGVCVL